MKLCRLNNVKIPNFIIIVKPLLVHSTYQLSASTSVHAQAFEVPNLTLLFQLNDVNKSTTNTSHTFQQNATRGLFTLDSYYSKESKLPKEVSYLEKKCVN